MMKKVRWIRLALASMFAIAMSLVQGVHTQLTYSSGTNAVNTIADTIDTTATVMLPVVVGLILLMTAIGVYYRFARKAKIGT